MVPASDPNQSYLSINQLPVSKREELQMLIEGSMLQFDSSATWSEFVSKCREPSGDFHPDVKQLSHRAAHMLDRLRSKGAPLVTKTAPWSLKKKLEALKCGPRQSSHENVNFLCGEFVDMIQNGKWILLPAHTVIHKKKNCMSPLDIMPQRGRRPRTICDYSFFW
jgi:hypothetical protein